MRFGPRNRVFCTTTTTGTGPYLLGPAFVQHQDFSVLADDTYTPYQIAYGSQWECGIGRKSGNFLIRHAVLESTNGNAPVNWTSSEPKPIAIEFLAQNAIESTDNSIAINDNPLTGRTNVQGLTMSAVLAALAAGTFNEGIDLKITTTSSPLKFFFDVLRIPQVDVDASEGIAVLNFAKAIGSVKVVDITQHTEVMFSNMTVGQEAFVQFNYDQFGNRKITWPKFGFDQMPIWWVDGYEPETTPIGGGIDAFKFLRTSDVNIGTEEDPLYSPRYIGWVLNEHRPKVIELNATPNVEAEVVTLTEGSTGGPNEIQYLSATVTSDYLSFLLKRTGTVSGGTFDLTIQEDFSEEDPVNHVIEDVPYDVTATELLELVWAESPAVLTPYVVNVASGADGALCGAQLSDATGEIGLEFLGYHRYLGYVISIDGTNLTGGGSYGVEATGSGAGSNPWIFAPENIYVQGSEFVPSQLAPGTMKLTFNGQTTGAIAWGEIVNELVIIDHLDRVKAALEGLSNIGAGNIKVSGSRFAVYRFEFIGDLSGQNVSGEIQFAPGFLPESLEGVADGQLYGTTRNGVGPPSVDEVHELTISGDPIDGEVILTINDEVVHIPVLSSVEEVQVLLNALDGFYVDETETSPAYANTLVEGGPLPTDPITITFINDFGGQDISDSSVDVFSAGAPTLDHSICDVAVINFMATLTGVEGNYSILHKNPIPGKTIIASLINEGSEFECAWSNVVHFYPTVVTLGLGGSTSEPGRNQVDRLTATNPAATGRYVVTVMGRNSQSLWGSHQARRVSLIAGEGNATVKQRIEAVIGLEVAVTGGPFPTNPIDIEWKGQYDCDHSPITIGGIFGGSEPPDDGSMDWVNRVAYSAGGGVISHLLEDGIVDWGVAAPSYVPNDRIFTLYFLDVSTTYIKARRHWQDDGYTVIEVRTSDPPNPVEGQIWFRSDL